MNKSLSQTFSRLFHCHKMYLLACSTTGVPSSRYECVMYIFSQESRCRVILFLLFFYKIYKGDLPLMYSCVFWGEFIDLVVFLAVIEVSLLYLFCRKEVKIK